MTVHKVPFRKSGWIAAGLLMVIVITTGCTFPGQAGIGSNTPQPIPINTDNSVAIESGQPTSNGAGDGQTGLSLRLSDGQAVPTVLEALEPVQGQPLSEEQIQEILDRLTPWQEDQGLEAEFRLPEEILRPPLTGETIQESFPSSSELEGPQPDYGEELAVLRFSPEGEVAIAPFISVTFNQPMIALNTLEGLAEENVPVQVTPLIAGSWRWLGTRTLTFQADSDLYDRLPMATEYLVTIPAGVESASGDTLQDTVQFSFSTPPPIMEDHYPTNSSQPLDPIFFISFDQRIDPGAVLENIHVTAGSQQVQLVMASEEEIKADEVVSRRVEHAQDGRWLAFRRNGDLWVADLDRALADDSVVTSDEARLFAPGGGLGFSFDPSGNGLVFTRGNRIYRAALPDGVPREIAGPVRVHRAPQPPLVVRNARLLSPDGTEFSSAGDVYIDGGRIMALGEAPSGFDPGGAVVVDAEGRFAIPGLWDSHHHSGWILEMQRALRHGVTSVRDPGSPLMRAVQESDMARAGMADAPRRFSSGEIFEGLHDNYWGRWNRLTTEEEATRHVRLWQALGARFIKVYRSLPWSLQRAVAAEARQQGLPVIGHGIAHEEVVRSVVAGYRSLEHDPFPDVWHEDARHNFLQTTQHGYTLLMLMEISLTDIR